MIPSLPHLKNIFSEGGQDYFKVTHVMPLSIPVPAHRGYCKLFVVSPLISQPFYLSLDSSQKRQPCVKIKMYLKPFLVLDRTGRG